MTICLHNPSTDPAFNLAAEEHLLRTASDDVFMVWRNEPAIIIGRNQNAYSEINLRYVEEHGIRVVRRLSGGGAVFHDLGNVNFTFIATQPEGPKIDFERYTAPILDALRDLGVEARFEGRNDLTVAGRKISGNAQHIYRDRVLHHGTLLYASEISALSAALKANPAKFEDKAVKSVRSRVTNITDHLAEPIPVEAFIDRILAHVISSYEDAIPYSWTAEDLAAIERLRAEKYDTWAWNFGRSPDYNFQQTKRTPGGTLEVQLAVEDGVIEDLRIYGDYFGMRGIQEVEEALRGARHKPDVIAGILDQFDLEEYMKAVPRELLIEAFF